MGWETVAVVGFQLLSGRAGVSQARSQAQAIADEGSRNALSVADNTVRRAGTLQTSFLQSGLTLEGGPMDVISRAFAKGTTDIRSIESNTNAQTKNIMGVARTKALTSLASSVAGSAGSVLGDFGSGFEEGFNNSAIGDLGGIAGDSPSYGPIWQSNTPLPWRAV